MTLDEILPLLDTSRAELHDSIEAVPVPLRDARPAPDRWSVAEVLEHLAIVETGVRRVLLTLARDVAGEVREPGGAPRPGMDLRGLVDRTMRVASLAQAVPSRGLPWQAAREELNRSRAELLAVIASVRHRPIERASRPHYLLGALSGIEWIEFVARHEQRHAAQVREIGAYMSGIGPGAA
ncbi:MAG TPA: DinB family protein [Longimicrobiales bacterium]|nr:DinB family protein [Longimicrobiales bacterium]